MNMRTRSTAGPARRRFTARTGLIIRAFLIICIFGASGTTYGGERQLKLDYHFDGTISREVLENYLDHSVTMAYFLVTGVPERNRPYPYKQDDVRLIENIGATKGLVHSQHIMLELIKRGATRMEAYEIVQKAALEAYNSGKDFQGLILEDTRMNEYMSREEIENCFDLEYHLRQIDKIFKNIGL